MVLIGALVALFATIASAAPVTEVKIAVGPYLPGASESYRGFANFFVSDLVSNNGPFGNPETDPTAYRPSPNGVVRPHEVFATPGSHSWRGKVGPVGDKVANEEGNGIVPGMKIDSDGAFQFDITTLTVELTSDDSAHSFNSSMSFPDLHFGVGLVGGSYGEDHIRNTSDDRVFESGPAAGVMLDWVGFAGFQFGYKTVTASAPVGVSVVIGTTQEQIDAGIEYIKQEEPIGISGNYGFQSTAGPQNVPFTVVIASVPEPSGLVFLGIAAAVLRRRRSAL